MDINGEIDRNTVVVGDFKNLVTLMDRPSRQKINKERVALNDPLDQMDLIYLVKGFHPKAAEYTYFSSVPDKTQVSINLRRSKSYQASSLTTML